MRHEHPVEYNDEMYEEVQSRNRRLRWTDEELEEMASEESKYEGNDLLTYLADLTGRTREAIKSRRRFLAYKNLVEQFRRDREVATEEMISEDETSNADDLEATNLDMNESATSFVAGPEMQVMSEDEDQTQNLQPDDTVHLLNAFESALEQAANDSVKQHLIRICANEETEVEDLQLISQVCQGATNSTDMFENWTEQLISKYGKPMKEHRNVNTNNRNRSTTMNRRKKRIHEYREAQKRFKKDTRRLAHNIIDGTGQAEETERPTNEDILLAYNIILASESINDEQPTTRHPNERMMYRPITREDVRLVVQNTGKTSAGTDGIDSTVMKKIPQNKLEILYNIMIYKQYIPKVLKKSRTILIPKKQNELRNIDNWRPLTISSLLLRNINKIIAKRISSIPICDLQRGFTTVDGCFLNNMTLQTIIKNHRIQGRGLAIITIDLKKAFDTVSHSSVKRALERFHIDEKTTNYIMDNLRDSFTDMYCCGEMAGTIQIKRGVKQGDPLSPVLFNLVLDELLTVLDEQKGADIGAVDIPVMGYADDLVIMANDHKQAQKLLNKTSEFFENRHLQMNIQKCSSLVLSVVPNKKKTYVRKTPTFYVKGRPIPAIDVENMFKYLGMYFKYNGTTRCDIGELDNQLTRIAKSALKPQQKLVIIKRYLIPKYIHALQSPAINSKILKTADRKIRSSIKRILHLPTHLSDAALYTQCREGGLGIFSFSRKIPLIINNRVQKLRGLSVRVDNVINESNRTIVRINKIVKQGYRTHDEINRTNASELEASFYGNGLRQVNQNNASNTYIDNPPIFWKGKDFIKAVQLRLNCLPTKGLPYNPPAERMCRAGCQRVESLSHVLQKCHIGFSRRIERHNHIVRRLKIMAAKKQWNVEEEPHIRNLRGVLQKPDLLFRKNSDIIIADVGVSWEAPRNLNESYECKVASYSIDEFVGAVSQKHPGCSIKVMALIMGARGIWCSRNDELMEALGINTKYNKKEMVYTTIKGSWIIHAEHMRRT